MEEEGVNAIFYPSRKPPEFNIIAEGKKYHFEWHPYCGPVVLTNKGDPASVQPQSFLYAACQWDTQGRKMENGLCVWFHDPEPIIEKVFRTSFLKGHKPAVRGT